MGTSLYGCKFRRPRVAELASSLVEDFSLGDLYFLVRFTCVRSPHPPHSLFHPPHHRPGGEDGQMRHGGHVHQFLPSSLPHPKSPACLRSAEWECPAWLPIVIQQIRNGRTLTWKTPQIGRRPAENIATGSFAARSRRNLSLYPTKSGEHGRGSSTRIY